MEEKLRRCSAALGMPASALSREAFANYLADDLPAETSPCAGVSMNRPSGVIRCPRHTRVATTTPGRSPFACRRSGRFANVPAGTTIDSFSTQVRLRDSDNSRGSSLRRRFGQTVGLGSQPAALAQLVHAPGSTRPSANRGQRPIVRFEPVFITPGMVATGRFLRAWHRTNTVHLCRSFHYRVCASLYPE